MPEPSTDKAHDVLAAEAFAVPAADRMLRHDPLVLPDDPSGISAPHDILAAEEFPMPAGRPGGSARAQAHRRWLGAALAAGVGVALLRRLRRS